MADTQTSTYTSGWVTSSLCAVTGMLVCYVFFEGNPMLHTRSRETMLWIAVSLWLCLVMAGHLELSYRASFMIATLGVIAGSALKGSRDTRELRRRNLAYIVVVYGYIVMAYMIMAYIVMACMVMACIVITM